MREGGGVMEIIRGGYEEGMEERLVGRGNGDEVGNMGREGGKGWRGGEEGIRDKGK
jgi:hypothetical protein